MAEPIDVLNVELRRARENYQSAQNSNLSEASPQNLFGEYLSGLRYAIMIHMNACCKNGTLPEPPPRVLVERLSQIEKLLNLPKKQYSSYSEDLRKRQWNKDPYKGYSQIPF